MLEAKKNKNIFRPLIGYVQKPSSFARFCYDFGLDEEQALLDLSPGDTHDAKYFAHNGIHVYICDPIYTQIINTNITNVPYTFPNIISYNYDLPSFGTIYAKNVFDQSNITSSNILEWLFQTLVPGALLCIESKSLDINKFLTQLEDIGFHIVYCNEGKFYPLNNINYMRIIAQHPYIESSSPGKKFTLSLSKK